ncbi:MAG TPA: hypothetical protein VGU64_21285, partial [Terriglobales bacterium]|nr:hypothetical protein [Terriglobales bacterium]
MLDPVFSSELAYLSAVALGRSFLGGWSEIHACSPLFCELDSEFTARPGFLVELPGYRRGAANFA